MKIRRPVLEILLLALTEIAFAAIFVGSGLPRTLAAGLLMFVLPGCAILAAWFPRLLANAPANILFTVTLSLAAAAIGGLVLNFLPVGLTAQTWALWLGGIALLNTLLAALRDFRARNNELVVSGLSFRLGQVLLFVLAGTLVYSAVSLARTGAIEEPRPGFTQLWMIQTGSDSAAQLGFRNEENRPVTYWLVVQRGGTPIQAYYDLSLDSGATWETTLELMPNDTESQQPFVALLYQADQPQRVYRSVTLWLPNTSTG